MQRCPLYSLIFNIIQQLITRGFGYKIEKLCRLDQNELADLMLQIKVMPGHKVKLYKLIDYIKTVLFLFPLNNRTKQIIPDIMVESQMSKKKKRKTTKMAKTPKEPQSYKEYLRNKAYKPKTAVRPGSAKKRKGKRGKTAQKKREKTSRLKQIGVDYFDDKNNNLYHQF